MNDETLSALADDELPPEATREVVTALLAEPQARATWGRYHLIGDALRASVGQEISLPAAQPRSDNVVPFPTPNIAPPPARKLLSRTALSLAAAAALAAVALLVAQPAPPGGNGAAPVASRDDSADRLPYLPTSDDRRLVVSDADLATNPALAPVSVSQTGMVKEDEAQKRMNVYLINFNDQRARQRATGAHPYVHIIGYDTP